MPLVRMTIVEEEFRCTGATHVSQGGYAVGTEPQYTVLQSCICIGFLDPVTRLGAISHITRIDGEGAHTPGGALDVIMRNFARRNVPLDRCECFVVGGSERSPRTYEAALQTLQRRNIEYRELDVLGVFYRKLLFDPRSGNLKVFRKARGDMKPARFFAMDSSLERFNDPTTRIATGATLFFRNPHLLHCIKTHVMPAVQNAHWRRCHVWCAGCSNGMEAYTVAMTLLEQFHANRCTLPLKVLGTDISEDALEEARRGIYTHSANQRSQSFSALLERFTERIDTHQISMNKDIRKITLFKHRDIREGSRSHRFELIVCDHVFQYFSPEDQWIFAERLVDALQPEAYLYLSTPTFKVANTLAERLPLISLERNFYRRR